MMQMKHILRIINIVFVIMFLAGFSSCRNNEPLAPTGTTPTTSLIAPALSEADLERMSKDEIVTYLKRRATVANPPISEVVKMKDSLSFSVCNKSGAPFYCCCFYYIKNKLIGRWRWDKSKIYKVQPARTRLIVLDESVDDERDRNAVFGYLGVFKSKEEALNSVMDMIEEEKLLDLDLLYKIKNKVIEIGVKQYGIKGERLSYAALESITTNNKPSLDLLVENQSGRDLFLTCFVYEQPEHTHNFDLWTYDKTEVKKAANGQQIRLEIPSSNDQYRWSYMRGVLGVFDSNDEAVAQNATFELAKPINKLELGLLASLTDKKIILSIEHYGILGDFIDYVIKPAVFVNKHRHKKLA